MIVNKFHDCGVLILRGIMQDSVMKTEYSVVLVCVGVSNLCDDFILDVTKKLLS